MGSRNSPERKAWLQYDDLDELAAHLHPDNPKLHDLHALTTAAVIGRGRLVRAEALAGVRTPARRDCAPGPGGVSTGRERPQEALLFQVVEAPEYRIVDGYVVHSSRCQ